jgi:hypothetical protein
MLMQADSTAADHESGDRLGYAALAWRYGDRHFPGKVYSQ